MRKVVLFIASSLDGYIARKDGAVDWCFTDNDYGYQDFYQSVDTVIMGRRTYEKNLEFSGGSNPFKDKKNFVFTRNPNAIPTNENKDEEPYFVDNVVESVKQMVQSSGKDIYLEGGSEITTVLLRANLAHEIILSIHPTLLGSGIPLFEDVGRQINLKLKKSTSFDSGLIQLHYMCVPEVPHTVNVE